MGPNDFALAGIFRGEVVVHLLGRLLEVVALNVVGPCLPDRAEHHRALNHRHDRQLAAGLQGADQLVEAIREALGDARGIRRYGTQVLPMADSKAEVSVDVSNRAYLVYNARLSNDRVGNFDVSLVEDFAYALAQNAGLDLHVNLAYGEGPHHAAEAIFKGLARALRPGARDRPAPDRAANGQGRVVAMAAASPRIAVLDYGAGNLRSVAKAVERSGCHADVCSDAAALRLADGVVLPGVGAFADAAASLAEKGLDDAVRESVRSGSRTSGSASACSSCSRTATNTA